MGTPPPYYHETEESTVIILDGSDMVGEHLPAISTADGNRGTFGVESV
jgi:hypothetical protein